MAKMAIEVVEERFHEYVPRVRKISRHIVEMMLIDKVKLRWPRHIPRNPQNMWNHDAKINGIFSASDQSERRMSLKVLKKRYLRRDESCLVMETPRDMFARVACHVSRAEARYGGNTEYWQRKFQE